MTLLFNLAPHLALSIVSSHLNLVVGSKINSHKIPGVSGYELVVRCITKHLGSDFTLCSSVRCYVDYAVQFSAVPKPPTPLLGERRDSVMHITSFFTPAYGQHSIAGASGIMVLPQAQHGFKRVVIMPVCCGTSAQIFYRSVYPIAGGLNSNLYNSETVKSVSRLPPLAKEYLHTLREGSQNPFAKFWPAGKHIVYNTEIHSTGGSVGRGSQQDHLELLLKCPDVGLFCIHPNIRDDAVDVRERLLELSDSYYTVLALSGAENKPDFQETLDSISCVAGPDDPRFVLPAFEKVAAVIVEAFAGSPEPTTHGGTPGGGALRSEFRTMITSEKVSHHVGVLCCFAYYR
jgi:hypothetical protein